MNKMTISRLSMLVDDNIIQSIKHDLRWVYSTMNIDLSLLLSMTIHEYRVINSYYKIW